MIAHSSNDWVNQLTTVLIWYLGFGTNFSHTASKHMHGLTAPDIISQPLHSCKLS